MNRKQIFFWLIGFTIAAGAIFVAFYFDEAADSYIRSHQTRELKALMRGVSRWGDWPAHVALGLVLAAMAWLRKNKKWTRIFLSMLIACAIAGLAARVIKIGVGRARPSVQTEAAWSGPSLNSKFHAFPSGHTAASTAFFAVLLLVNWRIGAGLMAAPLLIGFSRMYVAAHYASDIVFALFLGFVCAVLVMRFWLSSPIGNRQSPVAN